MDDFGFSGFENFRFLHVTMAVSVIICLAARWGVVVVSGPRYQIDCGLIEFRELPDRILYLFFGFFEHTWDKYSF